MNSKNNLQLLNHIIWILIFISTYSSSQARKLTRCELGEELLAHNFNYSELGDWICLAEKCSGLNVSLKLSYTSTNSTLYGLFQLSNKFWCSDELYPDTDDCSIKCDKLLDNNLTDDLRCARKIANDKPNFGHWDPRFNACREINTTYYIEGCKFSNETGLTTEEDGKNEDSNENETLIVALGVSSSVIFIIVMLASYKFVRHYRNNKFSNAGIKSIKQIRNSLKITRLGHRLETSADMQVELSEFTKYEIASSDFQFDKSNILGCGHFGIVYEGLYKDETVAIKTVKDDKDKMSLIYELKVMSFIGAHQYIVHFIGIYVEHLENNKLYLLVEHCQLGNVHDYLQSHRKLSICSSREITPHCYLQFDEMKVDVDNDFVSLHNMILWSYQIADAMVYLSSKKVIHGDLAARNVLLKEKTQIKLTDFGLSKKLYNDSIYKRTNEKDVPWRWLSPEALIDNSYSTDSDKWSFGVTLWEIFSLAQLPFPGLSCYEYLQKLKENYRLEKPDQAFDEIYEIMKNCWIEEPSQRPSFENMREQLLSLTNVC